MIEFSLKLLDLGREPRHACADRRLAFLRHENVVRMQISSVSVSEADSFVLTKTSAEVLLGYEMVSQAPSRFGARVVIPVLGYRLIADC